MFNSTYLKEILSGDSYLDGYLQQVDKKLWGMPKYRALTLLELKDHLELKKQKYLDQGLSLELASTKAISEMGSIGFIATNQRKELINELVTTTLISGISFAVLMYVLVYLVFLYAYRSSIFLSFWEFLRYGMYFGIFMGFFKLVYLNRSVPKKIISSEKYKVKYAFHYRLISAACASYVIVNASKGVLFSLQHFQSSHRMALVNCVVSIPLILFMLWSLISIFNEISVNKNGLTIVKNLFSDRISWDQIKSVQVVTSKFPINIKRTIILYENISGKAKKMVIHFQMENIDQLIFDANERISSKM